MENNHAAPYQIAILGGGLAGLTLAIRLSQAGLKVALFEKHKYPFHRVCGEYLSLEVIPFLNRIGVYFTEANYPIQKRLELSAPNGKQVFSPLPLGGLGVSRYELDFLLMERAGAAGAAVFEGTQVSAYQKLADNLFQIQTSAGEFSAEVVIAAFGKRSTLHTPEARNLAAVTYVGIKHHLNSDIPLDLIGLHHFAGGYAGISRVAPTSTGGNTCFCYQVSAEKLKSVGGSIERLEAEVLAQNPRLAYILQHYPKVWAKPLTISNYHFRQQPILTPEGAIAVGDVAGLIPPLAGNGMAMAIRSADLLATELIQYFQGHKKGSFNPSNYHKQWKAHFSLRLAAGRTIQPFLNSANLNNSALGLLSLFPKLLPLIAQLTHGKPW